MEDHDITIREIARELNRLAKAIDSLSAEVKSDLNAIKKETVRQDVYSADRRTDEVEMSDLQRRIEGMEVRAKSLTTAFTGMLLSVMGGVIIFLITRGFN